MKGWITLKNGARVQVANIATYCKSGDVREERRCYLDMIGDTSNVVRYTEETPEELDALIAAAQKEGE